MTIDVSGEDKLNYDLKRLAEALVVQDDDALFKTTELLAKNKKIIFLLDDVAENADTFEQFEKLWNIRHFVYIIMTTTKHSNFPDAKQLEVEKFDEALDFLREIDPEENSQEDLENLCKYFDWNVFGLAVAKVVGFTYTQQQAFLEDKAYVDFERARKMLKGSINLAIYYTEKIISFLLKMFMTTGWNNLMLPTLFIVVNNVKNTLTSS